jgi:hypothetical protein
MDKQQRIDAAPFFEHFNAAHLDDDGVPVARVKLDDAECDPFQVTFDLQGMATINPGSYDYLMLDRDMLTTLAEMSETAERLYAEWLKTPSGRAWSREGS